MNYAGNMRNLKYQFEEEETEASISGEILVMMLLLTFSIIISFLVKKYKIPFFNESIISAILGIIAGLFMYFLQNYSYMDNISHEYAKFFLIFLLPPIIFQSAYNLDKKYFFKQIGSIIIFAIPGTFISIFVIAGLVLLSSHLGFFYLNFDFKASLALGAIISSTDPICILGAFKDFTVDPNFYQLIFGESLMNDAVSIVFYEAGVDYNKDKAVMINVLISLGKFFLVMLGSISVGFIFGYLSALILKYVAYKRVKNIINIEIGLLLILPWVSYLLAQMCYLSGIVAILFNGIACALYVKPNLTEKSKEAIKLSYDTIAHICENLVFIYLGLGFFAYRNYYSYVSAPGIIYLILIIILARFISIYLLSFFANIGRTNNYLDSKKQFFLVYAGVRGSMSYALAIKSDTDFKTEGKTILVVTLIYTGFTLLYSSIFTKCLLDYCGLLSSNSYIKDDSKFLNNDEIQLERGKNCFNSVKYCCNYINENMFLRFTKMKENEASLLEENNNSEYNNEYNHYNQTIIEKIDDNKYEHELESKSLNNMNSFISKSEYLNNKEKFIIEKNCEFQLI